MRLLPVFLVAAAAAAQSWIAVKSPTDASLRGLSAANADSVWASGSGGTYLHTTDGGATWMAAKVPGAEALDFRDVDAVDDRTVYLMSIGTGSQSRIYKTTDGGATWKLMLMNPDDEGFFDAIEFWDRQHGIIVGDPVGGHFVVITTSDGGAHWDKPSMPDAMPKEGAFAASGTCLVVRDTREVWFATGGPKGARVFHSQDRGMTWTVATTPIRNQTASQGIFSIAFSDARHGIAVGGDYTKPGQAEHNIAVTSDGGRTWNEPAGAHPDGFRSAVAFLPDLKMWIATGTSGSDVSTDDGATWKKFDAGAYNAVSFISVKAGWAVGPSGRLARFRLP